MKKNIGKLLICIPFLVLIFGMAIGTLSNAKPALVDILTGRQSEPVTVNSLESMLMNNLPGKGYLTASYGISQKILNRNYVGDKQFYQDKDNIMHMSSGYRDGTKLAEDIRYLADNLSANNIPFLVCQIAERAAFGNELSRYVDGDSLAYIADIKSAIEGTNTLYLDYIEKFSEADFSSQDIFFKTDIHYSTEAEFYIAEQIINLLEENTDLVFENKDIVFDLENYTIEKYPFWGNLYDSVGKFYTGTDTFSYYIPKYATSMSLTNPPSGIQKSGTFEDTCMNNHREPQNKTERVYHVTNYMQWPSPYYTVTNNLVQDHNILLIGCSMSMRTSAYLSLLCHTVTVLDPRFFAETDYLSMALNNKYDAVICFPSYNLASSGVGGYSAEIVDYRIIEKENGLLDLQVDVKNTGTSAWHTYDNIALQIILGQLQTPINTGSGLSWDVAPEDVYIFTLTDLPESFRLYNASAQMSKTGSFFFGENEALVSETNAPDQLLQAEIISHTTPTQMYGDENYSFDVVVKNTGTSAWTSEGQIRLCMFINGADNGYRLTLPNDVTVLPGEEHTFRMDGFYLASGAQIEIGHQMVQEGICYFGELETVQIHVY